LVKGFRKLQNLIVVYPYKRCLKLNARNIKFFTKNLRIKQKYP